jgi:acetyl-CoA carboxylase biotin carboxyl carrier protein
MSQPEEDAQPRVDASEASLVRKLADVLNETGLTEVEFERGDLRIRLTRSAGHVQLPPIAPQILAASLPAVAPQSAAPAAATQPAAPAGEVIKSPMVGTVYFQAQPGSAPFARVGDRVDEGQTVLLIEAMKTMNPIAAPRAGVLAQFLVADGQPVEFGEPLVVIG